MTQIMPGTPGDTNPTDHLYPVTEAAELLVRWSGHEYNSLAGLSKRALRAGAEAGEIPHRKVDGRLAFSDSELRLGSTLTAFVEWLEITSSDEARERLEADKAAGARRAEAWNARYPVGTSVMAYPMVRPEDPIAVEHQRRLKAGRTFGSSDPCERLTTRTRSRAWTLGHGEPVVLVEGYSGGIILEHVDPIGGDER